MASQTPESKTKDKETGHPHFLPPPDSIFAHAPWYRIYIGQVKKNNQYHPVWAFFGKTTDGKEKNTLYHSPTQGRQAELGLAYKIDTATVPRELHGGVHYFWTAAQLAEDTWGERKTREELGRVRRGWVGCETRRRKKEGEARRKEDIRLKQQQSAIRGSGDARPRSGEKRKAADDDAGELGAGSSEAVVPAPGDRDRRAEIGDQNEEAVWDNEAVEKAWMAFREPCSEFVTARMGDILHKRHDLSTVPPKDLLVDMREYGQLLAMMNPPAVFRYRPWCVWLKDHSVVPGVEEEKPSINFAMSLENIRKDLALCKSLCEDTDDNTEAIEGGLSG